MVCGASCVEAVHDKNIAPFELVFDTIFVVASLDGADGGL
jgi:hypothetical protein